MYTYHKRYQRSNKSQTESESEMSLSVCNILYFRVIERTIDKLARRHGVHINEYDASNGADNAKRLNGKNGMPHIRDFTAGNYSIFIALISGINSATRRNSIVLLHIENAFKSQW